MNEYRFEYPLILVGCIVEQDGKFLLVKEADGPSEGKWNFPSGKLDHEESMANGAKRETLEECGYAVDIDGLVGIYKPEWKTSCYVFLFSGKSEKTTGELGHDIAEAKWFTREEIFAMDSTELRALGSWEEAIDDYESSKRYPLELIREKN